MAFRILEFMVVLAFIEWIGSLPLSCLYNGTSHKEGETVGTDEPCLSCVCQNGALECNLRVCADYPNVLPPGCFLLHKPNQCCLQIFCDESFSLSGIELRTSFKSEKEFHENDCIINGSIYGEGSAVASSQLCEYCYCVEGEIKCIKPRCPHPFEGCKAVYETSSCCPTHYDCRESNVNFLTTQMKNFVSADENVTIINNFLRSHLNLDLKPKKGDLNISENAETDLSKIEGKHAGESTMTVTEKGNIEETTVAPVQISTLPMTGDYLTILGFQTMKTDSFSKESSVVLFTETSTLEMTKGSNISSSINGDIEEATEVQMRRTLNSFKEIESSMASHDGSPENVSQKIVDYDSYDYSEPQLPPSLPNLVIFPFVAADAVVKGESTGEPDLYEKDQIEKVDGHRVFDKDYFFPPIKSEGGFVPKKPSKSEERFYEKVHLSKEQVGFSNKGMKENAVAASQVNIFPQGPNVFADNKGTNATSPDGLEDSVFNMTIDPLFEDIIKQDSDSTSGFLLRDEDKKTKLYENNHTKKPVTVTFKNFVVDFYPNYLITTSKRIKTETETQTTTEEGFTTQKSQDLVVALNATSDSLFKFYDKTTISALSEAKKESPAIIPVNSPGEETFFFNKFIHSFLSEATSTAVAVTSTSKKHKISSKIKNQLITTAKPKKEEINQKDEVKIDISGFSTESYSVLSKGSTASFSVADIPKNDNKVRKPIKGEEITRFIEAIKPSEAKNEKIELSESHLGGNLTSVNRKPDIGGENCATSNAGTLLKLAGCNIYGMMYRVGKVITELSGPCLECLCTDLGVQCNPLKC